MAHFYKQPKKYKKIDRQAQSQNQIKLHQLVQQTNLLLLEMHQIIFLSIPIQIIKEQSTMIRRTTPNKSFQHDRLNSSCCRWFGQEQLKHQLSFAVGRKKARTKFSINTSSCSRNDQANEENVYETPMKMSLPMQKEFGNSNEIGWVSARTIGDHKLQTLIILPSSQAAKNPLQRLQKLHRKNDKMIQTLAITTISSKPISFTYMTPKKQANFRASLSTGVATTFQSQQRQGLEQNTLRQELQTFRKENQQLLREYHELTKRKQTNLSTYKHLLAKLNAKKDEIAALQKLRREEIEGLRLQIEEVIAQREQMQTRS